MDKHFLEFWGNFLIGAAKDQRQIEDVAKWISQGLSGSENFATMFRRFYGLDHLPANPKETPDHLKTYKKAAEDFQKSFQEWLNLMNVVPKDEHLALVKKYEKLKNKARDQKETIKHLRMQISAKTTDQGELLENFTDLMKIQSEELQKSMEAIGRLFKQDNDPHSKKSA